jgi:hypothetical protein
MRLRAAKEREHRARPERFEPLEALLNPGSDALRLYAVPHVVPDIGHEGIGRAGRRFPEGLPQAALENAAEGASEDRAHHPVGPTVPEGAEDLDGPPEDTPRDGDDGRKPEGDVARAKEDHAGARRERGLG